jgi:hypothetical protein
MNYDKIAKRIEKDKAMFVGSEIEGKTLGVIGLGAIGGKVVNAALALGMKVVGYDPVLSFEAAWKLPGDRMTRAENLDELLKVEALERSLDSFRVEGFRDKGLDMNFIFCYFVLWISSVVIDKVSVQQTKS